MEVTSMVAQLSVGATLAILAFVVFVIFIRPAYIISFALRHNIWKAGCTVKSVKVGDNQFGYIERGRPSKDQPSFLFLHGFSDVKSSFCEMIKHLPRHLHLIAVDLPGHGDTTIKAKDDITVEAFAAKVHQFLSVLGLDCYQFHVVGHPMGGGLAGCYAALYPEQVPVVTLMCPGGVRVPEKSLMFKKIAAGKRYVMIPDTVAQAEEMFDMCQHNKSLVPPKQVLHITCLDVIKREVTADLQVDILEDCGHAINLEAPEKVVTLLLNFRDKVLKK